MKAPQINSIMAPAIAFNQLVLKNMCIWKIYTQRI